MSGEEDVAQGPPGRVRGDRLRLHAVDHDGHAEVDVSGEEENVKYEVVIQSRSIHLQGYFYSLFLWCDESFTCSR